MDDLEGRVHGQHRHADVQHRDAAVGHVLGNGAAAAQIQTAQLTDLPCHAVGIQQAGDVPYQLSGSIAGRALAAAAGVLEEGHAAACVSTVLRLEGICPGGVVGGGHIGGETHAVLEGKDVVLTGGAAQQLHKVEYIHALHAGHTVGADLFLIGQHADGGVHRIFRLDLGHKGGVCVHTVIVTVAAHHGAVKAHVPGLVGGHHLDLGAGEVPLGDAVLFVQQHQGVQLDGLLDVGILYSVGADEHVQLLGLDALAELAVVLLGTQMGQQVGDAEHGVILVLTHCKGHAGAISTGEHAVDGQRHGAPLVLADAAVIVGLEVAEVVCFVQRVRAQVQTGAVDVGDHQTEALLKRFPADGSGHHRLVLLHKVDLLAGGIGLFRLKLFVTGLQQQLFAGGGSFALGLGSVQEGFVAFGKGCSLLLHVGSLVGSVLRLVKQLFGSLLCGKFLAHVPYLLSAFCIDTLIPRIAGSDLFYVMVHLVIGKALQRFAVCGVLFHL